MCKPVKSNSPISATAAAIEVPADLVGPCGRRCRECKLAALTAELTADIPAHIAARAPSAAQISAFAN